MNRRGAPRRPDFIVIGSMKAGSTALARYLGAHPEVFVSPRKEIHFFDRHFDNGIDWYTDYFRGAGDGRLAGEATPAYMASPRAMERMAATVPNARLIASLRNPVDRAYSHYWHNRSRGREKRPFAVAIADGEPGAPDKFEYVSRGHYLAQLEHISEHYDRSQLHVLLFEDLRDDPGPAYASMCSFLGVDDQFVPDILGRRIYGHLHFRSLRVRRMSKRLHLPKRVGNAIAKVNTRPTPYPPLDDATRHLLQERFHDENANLARWLGRDLSIWN